MLYVLNQNGEEMENSKKPIMAIGHSPCLDGFASMWAVGHRFGFDNVEFVGVKYGDPVPDVTDREVYIVDFSYPPAVLIPAAKTAKKIVVLDHHETARKQWEPQQLTTGIHGWLSDQCPEMVGDLYSIGGEKTETVIWTLGWYIERYAPMPSNLEVVFRDDAAGAVTTWDHLFPGAPHPLVLKAIDHGDRWIFDQFPRVREVCEFCRSQGYLHANNKNFLSFNNLIFGTHEANWNPWGAYHELADRGADIAEAFDNLITEFVPFDKPRLIEFAGYVVPCHAVPDFFKSGVGDRFGKKYAFSITYDDNLVPGHRKFSLRSDKESGVNVEVIAKRFKGGGGHEHAAGFIVPFTYPHHDASVETMLEQATVTPIPKKLD